MSGDQPGSLVWAWMHWYVAPPYVTSCPTPYAVHVAHCVAVAHCAALSASPPEVDPSPLPVAQPIAAPSAANNRGSAVCLVVMPPVVARARAGGSPKTHGSPWIHSET
jgi:hypothetical protein